MARVKGELVLLYWIEETKIIILNSSIKILCKHTCVICNMKLPILWREMYSLIVTFLKAYLFYFYIVKLQLNQYKEAVVYFDREMFNEMYYECYKWWQDKFFLSMVHGFYALFTCKLHLYFVYKSLPLVWHLSIWNSSQISSVMCACAFDQIANRHLHFRRGNQVNRLNVKPSVLNGFTMYRQYLLLVQIIKNSPWLLTVCKHIIWCFDVLFMFTLTSVLSVYPTSLNALQVYAFYFFCYEFNTC